MSLDLTHLRDPERWKASRAHSDKHSQAKWIEKFNRLVTQLDYNTSIGYRDQGEFTYLVGCPAFTLFKFTHRGFFITHGFDVDEWKDYDYNQWGLDNLLQHNLHKWNIQPTNTIDLPSDFIFFPIQMMSGQLKIILKIMQWAKVNKRYVVFKGHPYTIDIRSEQDIWNTLQQKGIVNDYTILVNDINVDYLVDKSSAVWTHNSGVGLLAVLLNKPVAYFLKDEDHFYGPLATYCTSIEEAVEAIPATYTDICKYFNWYYDNVGLDMLWSDDLIKNQMRKRIEKVLC